LVQFDWNYVYFNPNAIHLWDQLDYNYMREHCKHFAEELVEYISHKIRLERISQYYQLEFSDYLDLLKKN
jgi:hypothetical protein